MLTLVAAVLVYDLAYDSALDTWDVFNGCEFLSSGLRSRNVRSETKEEKDIFKTGVYGIGFVEILGMRSIERMEAIVLENEQIPKTSQIVVASGVSTCRGGREQRN